VQEKGERDRETGHAAREISEIGGIANEEDGMIGEDEILAQVLAGIWLQEFDSHPTHVWKQIMPDLRRSIRKPNPREVSLRNCKQANSQVRREVVQNLKLRPQEGVRFGVDKAPCRPNRRPIGLTISLRNCSFDELNVRSFRC
jgi:hypothetical protein